MVRVTRLPENGKEKYTLMSEDVRKYIEEKTGKQCVSCIEIKSGDGLRAHYKVSLSDDQVYLFKILHLSESRLRTYNSIMQTDIDCFQKTLYLWEIQQNKYGALIEWKESLIPFGYRGCDKTAIIGYVKEAAKTIRKVHENFLRDEICITPKDVENFFDINRELLDSYQADILREYVVNNMRYLNGRKKTVIHGDLHLKNMMVTVEGSFFIDLDDCDYNDPYLDLIYASNLIKSSEEYVYYYHFLKSYFEDNIPQDFWIVVNIYSIYKAIFIMRCEKKFTYNHKPIFGFETFIRQHQMMHTHVPQWFMILEEQLNKERIR